MGVLAAAFSCVWVLVALYVGRLGWQQRQLAHRIQQLSPQREPFGQPRPKSKAA